MVCHEWGDPTNPRVLVCVHGLTRQGRDFDTLAKAMSDHYRVLCPDVVGRGESDWLPDPMGYVVPSYVADMVTLLARSGAQQVDWVGTSMGGLIGLGVASLFDREGRSPVRRLVLNDVGPSIQIEAVQRIGSYLGLPQRFASPEEGSAYLRSISSGFGPHSDEAWLALSRPQFKPVRDAQGEGWIPRYDPSIAVPFNAITPAMVTLGEAMLWQRFDSLRCPTLVIRGAESDLLSHDTALQMTQRGPKAQLAELPGIGHAPTLIAPEQVALVRSFLLEGTPA
jgi:pimeloyl-ACP methyl ester carboxylesterase